MSKEIRHEVFVDASIEVVFAAWTSGEGIAEFFASESCVEPRVGGKFEMYFMPADQADEVGRGSEGSTFTVFDPPSRLSFTWNAPPAVPTLRAQRAMTQVDLELEPVGEGTRVSLHQHGFGKGPDWDAYHAYFDRAWAQVLSNLREQYAKTA